MYSKAWKEPTVTFYDCVEEALAEKNLTIEGKILQDDLKFVYSKYGQTDRKPFFWRIRKALRAYREYRRIEYNCSPESETYWAS